MKLGFWLRKKIIFLHQKAREISYFLEYISWFIFSPYKFKKIPKKIKNILVIGSGALGDYFDPIRVVFYFKKFNKNKNFFLLVHDKKLFKNLQFLEKYCKIKFITIDDIKNYKFDATLIFTLSRNLKKYSRHFGFCVGNEYSSLVESMRNIFIFFLNRKIYPKNVNKLLQEIRVGKLIGLKFKFFPKERIVIRNRKVDRILSKNNIKKFVIIHAVGKNFSSLLKEGKTPAFSWPFERFAEISDYLTTHYKIPVFFTGEKEEKFIVERIMSACINKKKIYNIAGKLNVEELSSLISKAKLVISIDTSIIHIAGITNTPVIALFGPSFPEVNGVYGNPKVQINLFHQEICGKCRRKKECPEGNNICMKSINV